MAEITDDELKDGKTIDLQYTQQKKQVRNRHIQKHLYVVKDYGQQLHQNLRTVLKLPIYTTISTQLPQHNTINNSRRPKSEV